MKGFGTFDTTNTLYGSFYSRQQDPITNIPKYSKPNMEEEYYYKTVEMRKGYFNRYAHLYPDPTGKPIYNPIDAKAFKEEDAQRDMTLSQNQDVPQDKEMNQELNEGENTLIQKPHVFGHEMEDKNGGDMGDEPVIKTFHRNFEEQKE